MLESKLLELQHELLELGLKDYYGDEPLVRVRNRLDLAKQLQVTLQTFEDVIAAGDGELFTAKSVIE